MAKLSLRPKKNDFRARNTIRACRVTPLITASPKPASPPHNSTMSCSTTSRDLSSTASSKLRWHMRRAVASRLPRQVRCGSAANCKPKSKFKSFSTSQAKCCSPNTTRRTRCRLFIRRRFKMPPCSRSTAWVSGRRRVFRLAATTRSK